MRWFPTFHHHHHHHRRRRHPHPELMVIIYPFLEGIPIHQWICIDNLWFNRHLDSVQPPKKYLQHSSRWIIAAPGLVGEIAKFSVALYLPKLPQTCLGCWGATLPVLIITKRTSLVHCSDLAETPAYQKYKHCCLSRPFC